MMAWLHPLKPRRTGAPIKTLEKANFYQFNRLLTIGRMLVVPAESLTILYRLQISLSSDQFVVRSAVQTCSFLRHFTICLLSWIKHTD